ncbi:hypothetical protein ACIQPQ_14640 [Streptomyces sp. NPDC091281]|uniref:hypothetical protein n=1 Tax=Streptomyces sp. NPDC091281 TaxID=3365985 RepID=UPI00380B7D52
MTADAARITLRRVRLLLQGDEPVRGLRGLHGPGPSCVTGRTVQRTLTMLDGVVEPQALEPGGAGGSSAAVASPGVRARGAFARCGIPADGGS